MPYKHNKTGIFAVVAFAILNTHLEGYTSSMRFSV